MGGRKERRKEGRKGEEKKGRPNIQALVKELKKGTKIVNADVSRTRYELETF